VIASDRRLRAARRGAMATLAMSASFLVRPGLSPPPKLVAENIARRAAFEPDCLPSLIRQPAWSLAHVAFGSALAVLHDVAPRPRAGIPFGLAVWAAAYGVVLPLLGLYPRLDRDDRVRAAACVGAHLVYGAVLGSRRQ
jgi:hypothetical protein